MFMQHFFFTVGGEKTANILFQYCLEIRSYNIEGGKSARIQIFQNATAH